MGGDLGPRSTIPATLMMAAKYPKSQFILVGDTDALNSLLVSPLPVNVQLHHADSVVAMDEKPAQALRQKPGSSMKRALELVCQGRAGACVSAGNTGALMALSRHILKTLPGIERPAICKPLPTGKGLCYMLDLGANLNCSARQLYQFASLGHVLARASGVSNPKIGLLNVGLEEMKGGAVIHAAGAMIEADAALNYQGYVEGDGLYRGDVDVIVCDGFVGNVALKVSEGLARYVVAEAESLLRRDLWRKLCSFLLSPLLRSWRRQMDPARYNGASLLGLNGTVVKSHGHADARNFAYALEMTLELVQQDLPAQVELQMSRFVSEAQGHDIS